MSLIPKSVSRLGHRSLLKLNANSPTILVVAGVVGLGATAVMAAKATRKLEPIVENHQKGRSELSNVVYRNERARQQDLVNLYVKTSIDLGKLYGPTIFVGTSSAIAVLGGHKILRGRQIATMAAYSGLLEQFQGYRKRVVKTLGEEMERNIYDGAHGEWVEDPDHPGEFKLEAKFDENEKAPRDYLTPWFDETNYNWTRDPMSNYLFLKGVQQHMNNLLEARGHVFLNEARDALGLPRCREGQAAGWLRNGKGDNYVDFGFMASKDPNTVAFRNGAEKVVRLNFNIDGIIWDLI